MVNVQIKVTNVPSLSNYEKVRLIFMTLLVVFSALHVIGGIFLTEDMESETTLKVQGIDPTFIWICVGLVVCFNSFGFYGAFYHSHCVLMTYSVFSTFGWVLYLRAILTGQWFELIMFIKATSVLAMSYYLTHQLRDDSPLPIV